MNGRPTRIKKPIIVIGGGIIGVAAALKLQLDGHKVWLIDRSQPGRETSYGNAGVLSESSVYVLNNPGLLKALPWLLLNQSNGLRYNPLFALRRLGWLIRFLAHCRPSHVRHAALSLRALLLLSLDQHKKWIKDANVGHLLRQGGGWFKLFRTKKSFAKYAAEMEIMRDVGVKFTVFDREQIRQIEPSLAPIYYKGVLMDETCSISSPADLTDAYVSMFVAAGGAVERTDVIGLSHNDSGWRVQCKSGLYHSEDVVLAAGAWSAEIASWLGYDIPMAWERGYHLHFASERLNSENSPSVSAADSDDVIDKNKNFGKLELSRPILDVEGGFSVAPMLQGFRVTSGVELTDRDAPPNFQQISKSVSLASEALKLGAQVEKTPWMGRRPTLVDSLPMIGAAPRHKGLWFNFGHHHIGLSMAPGSALLLSSLINDAPPPIDPSPFQVSRFLI